METSVVQILGHPVTVTLVMAAILIAMQVAGQIAVAKLTPEQATRWPALAQAALTTVLISVVVVPTVNNLWSERRDEMNERRAQQREVERQQREVRDLHLERLRPLLLSDSKKLLQLAHQLTIEGTAYGGFLVKDYELALDSEYWYPELLSQDLVAHFPGYGMLRERVREEVLLQQKAVSDLHSLALALVQLEPQDENISVAMALVRACLGTGKGMNLEIKAGGYRYTDDGAPGTGAGDPPPNLVRRVRAYKAFKPNEAFKASCESVRERGNRLATELRTLSRQAAIFAESPVLSGDCSYVFPTNQIPPS